MFKITLLVPQPNPTRHAWAKMVQANLQALGIDVSLVILDWNAIYDRALLPPADKLGKSYDEGGFDLLFVGYSLGIDPDPWSFYHASQLAPLGGNYYLWNNSANDQLTSQIKATLDTNDRNRLVLDWQVLAYEELPSIPIFYSNDIVVFSSRIQNGQNAFTTYKPPVWPMIEHLSITPGYSPTVILAQTGPAGGTLGEGLNPLLTTSYYDLTVWGEVFNGLAQRNDTIYKNMLPALASGWQVLPDNRTWVVTLRTGVKWHDNMPFDASDVKFTFDSLQDSTLVAPMQAFYTGIIGGKSNVQVLNASAVQFSLPEPYAYFVQSILSTPILPRHALETVPYANWRSHEFNTALGCYTISTPGENMPRQSYDACGPIGTGPYKYVSYDSIGEVNKLSRNDNYFDFPENGKSALLAKGEFQVVDYYVRHLTGSDAATTAWSQGSVDILDSQYHLESQPTFLAENAANFTSDNGFGVQEIGVNMRHPVLGTGLGTPAGQQDSSKASEVARAIRQAISHAVPRDLIISELLNGYGVPAITTPIVGDPKTDTPLTMGFNTALEPYFFNLTKSAELLAKAGYITSIDSAGIQLNILLIVVPIAIAGGVVGFLLLRRYRRTRSLHSWVQKAVGSASPKQLDAPT